MTRQYPYRAPDLAKSIPGDPDLALLQAVADRQAQHAALARAAEYEADRLLEHAHAVDCQACPEQLDLWHPITGTRADLVEAYLLSGGSERLYLSRVAALHRNESIAAQALVREELASLRASYGLGQAGLASKSGSAARHAIGYEYRDTPAASYPPTDQAPSGHVPSLADLQKAKNTADNRRLDGLDRADDLVEVNNRCSALRRKRGRKRYQGIIRAQSSRSAGWLVGQLRKT